MKIGRFSSLKNPGVDSCISSINFLSNENTNVVKSISKQQKRIVNFFDLNTFFSPK
jgi:hypothetical protein